MKTNKKDLKIVRTILQEIDGLIDRLRDEDAVYGDMWQNFTDPCKDKITVELIAMVKRDLRKGVTHEI
jgi:hypothetical protein